MRCNSKVVTGLGLTVLLIGYDVTRFSRKNK